MIKKPAIWIGLGVLLLGYSIYVSYFSGTEHDRLSLLGKENEETVQVRLSPDMNPLRAFIRARNKNVQWSGADLGKRDRKEISVGITMSDSTGEDLWRETAQFTNSSDKPEGSIYKDAYQPLTTFEVPSEGDFTFSSKVTVYNGTPEKVELVIRRNVSRNSPLLITIGILSLLAGLALLLLNKFKNQIERVHTAKSDFTST